MTLKQELLASGLGLVEDDFSNHASDLYVLAKPGVEAWLRKNYNFWVNVRSFTGNGVGWQGKRCFDIPFGYMDEHIEQGRKISQQRAAEHHARHSIKD